MVLITLKLRKEVRKLEKMARRRKAKFEFNSLLREHGVDRHSRWLDVKRRIEDDPRYRAVESSAVREDYFKDFTRSLKVKDDRRKEKDKEKNGKKEKEKKDKKIKKVNEPPKPKVQYSAKQVQELKVALRQQLLETRSITHRSHAAVTGNPEARRTMHALLMHDPRYQALNDLPVQREQIIMTYLEELQRKGPPPLPTIS